MNYLIKSPLKSNLYTQYNDYNHYINKTPNYISRICLKNFSHICYCPCHCHTIKNKMPHNISYSRIDYINPIELDFEQKYKYHHALRNRSASNLFIPQNNSFEKLKMKYNKKYNVNSDNKQNKLIYRNYNNLESDKKRLETENNYRYQDINYKNNNKFGNNFNFDYRNIKIKNKNINNIYSSYNKNLNNLNINKNNKNNKNFILNKYETKIKPVKSFQIKRKELSQYYHTANPKKYSYGGEKLETANNTNNHQYKEVYETSKDKILQKSRVINFNDTQDGDDFLNKDDNIKNELNNELYINNDKNNKNNNKIVNYRYKTYQNSPKMISRNTYISKDTNNVLKPKIVNETNNTKYVESKDLNKNKNKSEKKYLYKSNGEINYYRNNLNNNNYKINNISYNLDFDTNNNNNLNNTSNPIEINNYKNHNYNYYKTNTYSNINHLKSIPKSYSVSNLNNYKVSTYKNLKSNIKNEYDNDYSNNFNQNKKENNIDYETIKLKVKLALLRKQMYEQEKQKIFNSGKNLNLNNRDYIENKKYLEKFLSKGNQNPIIVNNNNNSLLSKTKNLLEEKKFRNMKKFLNTQNNDNDNKILYSFKKSLREKNNEYNKNIINPKLKVWKP